MFDPKILGKNLKKARENKGLTQEELAEAMHYGTNTNISKFENGKKIPSLEILYSMAKNLDTTLSALLDPDYSIPKALETGEKLVSDKEILFKLDEILTILKSK